MVSELGYNKLPTPDYGGKNGVFRLASCTSRDALLKGGIL